MRTPTTKAEYQTCSIEDLLRLLWEVHGCEPRIDEKDRLVLAARRFRPVPRALGAIVLQERAAAIRVYLAVLAQERPVESLVGGSE